MITIALGIILAVFILAFLPEILHVVGWSLMVVIGFVVLLLLS